MLTRRVVEWRLVLRPRAVAAVMASLRNSWDLGSLDHESRYTATTPTDSDMLQLLSQRRLPWHSMAWTRQDSVGAAC